MNDSTRWWIDQQRIETIKRDMAEKAADLVEACSNGHDLPELIESLGAMYREVLAADPGARIRCPSTRERMREYAASVDRGPGRKVFTGLRPLDEATSGIAPGEVLTVVARPQVGKSAIASQILLNVAVKGEPSVYFSLEMPGEQAFERAGMQRLGLSRPRFEEVAKNEWSRLTSEDRAALDPLVVNLQIVDRAKSGIAELDASMLEACAHLGRPPSLAVIDYLGLLSSGSRNVPLYQRVSEAAVDVKGFAKRHRVAVVLLCQAGRDQDREQSEGAAELGLDSARDSGQVEEAADFLVTLWRPELNSRLSPTARLEVRGQMFGRIVKNRRGPRPGFRLHLDSETLRVTEWQEEA